MCSALRHRRRSVVGFSFELAITRLQYFSAPGSSKGTTPDRTLLDRGRVYVVDADLEAPLGEGEGEGEAHVPAAPHYYNVELKPTDCSSTSTLLLSSACPVSGYGLPRRAVGSANGLVGLAGLSVCCRSASYIS